MSLGIKGWEKCTLLTKPEQSGKTFIMLQKIVEDFSEEPRNDGKKNINFIMCDNNLLLVLQTSERLNDDEELNQFRNVDSGELYVEFSSSKRTNTNTSDAVFRLIVTESISNIISCTNGKRCDDTFKLISDINFTSSLKDKYHFNIWFDEADKFIPLINDYLIPAIEDFENISFYPITATPERIIKYFKEIKIWPIENPTLETYHSWNDNNITVYDNNICKSNTDFINHILQTKNEEIKPGTKWFIPANSLIASHINYKDILRSNGFSVLIINGNGINIYMPDGEIINCEKDDMPDTLIPKIYDKYKLYRFPFAITGYHCISRGISISSSRFMLTHAIMPMKIKNKNELSQIAGRMKGNQKGWSNYKIPKVYCTDNFNKIAKNVEEKTIKLAEIAFEENWETVTIEKFKMVEKNYSYYQHSERFRSYKDALCYLHENQDKFKGDREFSKNLIDVKKMNNRPHYHKTPNGYLLTSKLHKKDKIIKNIDNVEEERVTLDKLSKMGLGNNLSSPNSNTASYVIYPTYETQESQPEEVFFIVRHAVRKIIN